jgi:hypothetical protein
MTDDEISKLKLKDWPLPDEYLIELGRISGLWGSLENLLNVTIGKLAGFELGDPKAFILVTHASFPQRVDILSSLCEQLVSSYPTLKDYLQVVSALRDSQKQRNRYMHNGLGPNEQGDKIQIALGSARGSLKTSVNTVEIVDIRRVSVSIHNAMRALGKLVLGYDIPAIWESRRI